MVIMKSSLEMTQQYFDLSNQADLNAIEQLIHTEATYSSDNTGLYFGKKGIMLMMCEFFSKHQRLCWQIKSIEQKNDYITELQFHCDALNNEGETYQFSGIERIVVVDEMIRHIEVRT